MGKLKDIARKIKNKVFYTSKQDLIDANKQYHDYIKLLERKLWENNVNTNILLYELHLAKGIKKENFNPLVSIIIPVYNGSNYLEEAINCALKQTYKNIEIIVVNDGSTDDGKSRKIAKKYSKQIKYFEKENGGVSTALNYGIKKMTGDYFAWLSHDDLIEPNHIEKLVEYVSIKGNEKTIPYSAFKIIDENDVIRIDETMSAQLHCFDYKTSLLKNDYTLLKGEINGGSVLIPKEAFDKHGLFAEDQRITQERDMWSRLITEYKFICIPYDTAMIRTHSQQVTNTNPRIKIESDQKNLEIIKGISDERIKKLEMNKQSFYQVLKAHYKENCNYEMAEEIQKLIDETTNN